MKMGRKTIQDLLKVALEKTTNHLDDILWSFQLHPNFLLDLLIPLEVTQSMSIQNILVASTEEIVTFKIFD